MATVTTNPYPELITPPMRDWAQLSIARVGRRVVRLRSRRKRKLLLVHLDGVPRGLLEEAILSGRMPFLASLVRSGAYQMDSAFWGSPASTPCFQAGLLYGLRHPNLPAYQWFDRDLNRPIHMSVPRDASAIEEKLKGLRQGSLLEGGGTAYLSLFRADATNLFSMAALADIRKLARTLRRQLTGLHAVRRQSLLAYFKHLLMERLQVGLDVVRWAGGLGDWRHERQYLLTSFFLNTLAWSLGHSRTLIDMVRGVPAIYLVFANFDEVAHRRGPRSEQATSALYRADGYLAELFAFSRLLDEPYDLYFLTDHGHVDCSPLEQRSGSRLEPHLLTGSSAGFSEGLERGLLDGRAAPTPRTANGAKPVIIEAGNFAHVYLEPGPQPLEARALLERHRAVLARVAAQKDIGLAALRRGDKAVALIQGELYGPEELERAPLHSDFSKRAVKDLLEELPHMSNAGDLVLFGEAFQPGGTVGFAWEFGSHGGVTRIETESVVLWPSGGPVQLGGLNHSTQLYERLSEAYRS